FLQESRRPATVACAWIHAAGVSLMFSHRLIASLALLLVLTGRLPAELHRVTQVELQPLAAQVQRLVAALDFLVAPLSQADKQALTDAGSAGAKGVDLIQTVLDKHCLAG